MTAPYDFQTWLKSLEGRSSAEMFTEGIRACGEAIINVSSDQPTDRAQFAKRVAEFLSWLKAKGTVKPESVPAGGLASLREHRPSPRRHRPHP